jgi:DNA mismatch repair protein PMS2
MQSSNRNALDAGATMVEVCLEAGDGLDELYVKDNGEGIPAQFLPDCAKPHYTSKLEKFEDILQLQTYGFRGEGLSALCTVSKEVNITTKRAEDEFPTHVTLNKHGDIINSSKLDAQNVKRNIYLTGIRQSGTEVRVLGLLSQYPVRLQILKKEIAKQIRLVRLQTI